MASLEELDGKSFRRDAWVRAEGGGGMSCLLEEGNLFERAGVGYSNVIGENLPPSASAARPDLSGPRLSGAWACRSCSIRVILTCRPCT